MVSVGILDHVGTGEYLIATISGNVRRRFADPAPLPVLREVPEQ